LRIFGTKREKETRDRRNCIEELHNLCCSLSIIRVFNLINIRWVGNIARMSDEKWI